MKKDKVEIWITVDSENPDLEDIAKAASRLENLGIDYMGKVGIGFTRRQWAPFLLSLSRFDHRFVSAWDGSERTVMGFPVRRIAEERE